jgi:CDP-glycerol glycerophosphotransferase
MNKDRYLFLRLKLLLKGFLPSLLFLFIPKIKTRIIFSSEFNITYKQNSKFLFEYFIATYPDKEVKFVINERALREKLTAEIGDYFIESESLTGMIYVLRAKTWVVSSLETPVGGIFLNVGRFVHHLGHGAPIKSIGLLEKYSNQKKKLYLKLISCNFSYFFSTSELFRATWAGFIGVNPNKITLMGQARNDILHAPNADIVNKIFSQDSSSINVLYAPTWRPFNETTLYPFENFDLIKLSAFLEKNNINIYLRLHPNFETSIPDEILASNRMKILSGSDVSEINDVLGAFDLLVTDYSSIYIDFLVTQKPMLFLPYDYEEYKDKIGFTIPYEKNTPGPKPETQAEFESELTKLIVNNDYYKEQRVLVNSKLNCLDKGSCKQNSDFILKQL